MKRITKRISVMALCIVMLIMSVVPAFAVNNTDATAQTASTYAGPIEDHSVIDCVNRYKMDDGRFNFTLKLPAGTDTYNVMVTVTRDCEGTRLFYDHLMYWSGGVWNTSLKLIYSYDGSDYYEMITNKFVSDGIGIKLNMNYNGVSYMATDAPNGSTTEGRGYWLSA